LAALLGGARSRRDEYIMINPLLSSPSMPSIWTRVVCEGLAPLYTHTKNSSLRFVSSPTCRIFSHCFVRFVYAFPLAIYPHLLPPASATGIFPPFSVLNYIVNDSRRPSASYPEHHMCRCKTRKLPLTIHPTLLSGCLHRLLARVILELGALCPCPVPSVLPVVAPS